MKKEEKKKSEKKKETKNPLYLIRKAMSDNFSKKVEESQKATFSMSGDIKAEDVKKDHIITNSLKQLGVGRTMVLSVQHIFAMFGATVLVPLLTGLNVSVTLFCAGIATLWFHFITKGKVPVFLGSSFAYLGAFAAVANGNPDLLPYAEGGVIFAGLVYVILAMFISIFGVKKVMRLFPPVVTGPIIVLIGITLAPSALNNCMQNTGYYLNGELIAKGIGSESALQAIASGASYQPRFIVAIIAILVIIICNIWGKGMIKIVPILMGIIVAYLVALAFGWVDFGAVKGSKIIGLPAFTLPKFSIEACITFAVVSLAAIIEHIGDVAAISATTNNNFFKDPGLVRTLLGDGIGTSLAGFLGGPANTTYSENTGVIALTGVRDPQVVRFAAIGAILMSLFPIVDNFINSIPSEVIGGISFILYGMISAVGLRNLVENKVDFTNTRNVIIAAIIMVSGLAFGSQPIVIPVGSVTLSFGGIASAAIFGIILNAILPGKDYEFK